MATIFIQRDNFFNQALVTQPILQRQLNQVKLRAVDLYSQILCNFQKSKKKVPPPKLVLKIHQVQVFLVL